MTYPRREPFFAHKYIRLLTKTCAANEIGPAACWLCTIIAGVEDAKRYRSPVTFYNGQLMPLFGTNKWATIDRARRRAIEGGWLHYEAPPAGARTRPGVYWCLIPSHAAGLTDDPVDESPEEFTAPENGYGEPATTPENGYGGGDGRGDGRGELPYLRPIPTPSSCPAPAGADLEVAEWFWGTILAMQPGRKPPKLDKWANTIRLMRERDGRTHADIRELIERVQADEFWSVQILSPDKLRQKWDDLQLRLKRTDKPMSRADELASAGISYIDAREE